MSHLQQQTPRRRQPSRFAIMFGLTAALVVVMGLTVALPGGVVSAPATVDPVADPAGVAAATVSVSRDPSLPSAAEVLGGTAPAFEEAPSTF